MKRKMNYLKPDIVPESFVNEDLLCVSPGYIEGVEIEDWSTSSNEDLVL